MLSCGPTLSGMTEPPRPPGEGNPTDPTAPFNPYTGNEPTPGSAPPPPPGAPQPPTYGTPTSGGGYPPPSSGAGGYAPPPAGGYGPPPGGAYPTGGTPPQYGYNPGGANEDKTWIMVAHFGGAAGAFFGGGAAGWIAPLVALLARGNQSPIVRQHAVAALNFQLLWTIIAVVGYALTCIVIGIIPVIGAVIVGTIFGIIAGVKANNNEPYSYPMTVSMIK
ncbi:hypothetical protein KRMM14A1004_46310 [Krasilnikovia sp. MM14-A1004]